MSEPQVPDTQPVLVKPAPVKRSRAWFFWALFGLGAFLAFALTGSLAGYQAAWQSRSQQNEISAASALAEQFQLAQEDLQAGRYDHARQRFEHILNSDPGYPGAADGLAQAISILYATATPSPLPPTPTLTPTPDLRPVEEQFTQASAEFNNSNWSTAIDLFIALRRTDPAYRATEVDGMLYLALRNRGVNKIVREANLEGGIYDLSLAEGFGPLDGEAENWRNLARLYMIGSSFWEVYPEQAVYYFGQVAAAAPGLTDASGWSAGERYRASLLHYADQLARQGEWCDAQEYYDMVANRGVDGSLQATAEYAALQCSPPTATPEDTPTATSTWTVTPTLPAGITPVVDTPTPTPTSPVQLTPTPTSPVQDTPTPTQEQPPAPSATPTATQEAPATPTETLSPPAPDEPTETPTSGG